MNVRVLDFETCLFRPGVMAPEAVCFTWQVPGEEPGIMHAEDLRALPTIRGWLEGTELLVGHNVVYDFAVMCARWPSLIPLVFKAYDDDRISCTKLRQQLLDIAAGEFRGYLHRFEKEVVVEECVMHEGCCTSPQTCKVLGHVKEVTCLKKSARFMPYKYDLSRRGTACGVQAFRQGNLAIALRGFSARATLRVA